jgi:hypothetical protein
VNGGDVRVIERGEHLRFALEPCESNRISCEGLRQNLERDVAIEHFIARTIDVAHPTRPDELENLIDTDTRARQHRVTYLTRKGSGQVQGGREEAVVGPVLRKQCLDLLAHRVVGPAAPVEKTGARVAVQTVSTVIGVLDLLPAIHTRFGVLT